MLCTCCDTAIPRSLRCMTETVLKEVVGVLWDTGCTDWKAAAQEWMCDAGKQADGGQDHRARPEVSVRQPGHH